MTIIKTTCWHCGDVEIMPADILLVFTEENAGEGVYEFTCPRCGVLQERPVSQRYTSLLLAVGTHYELRIKFPKLTEESITLMSANLAMRNTGSIMDEIERLGY